MQYPGDQSNQYSTQGFKCFLHGPLLECRRKAKLLTCTIQTAAAENQCYSLGSDTKLQVKLININM